MGERPRPAPAPPDGDPGLLGSAGEERLAVLGSGAAVLVGPRREGDRAALFAMFADVVERGDGYPHAPPLGEEVFEAVWVDPPVRTVVAREARGTPVVPGADGAPAPAGGGAVVGAYYLRPNFPGRAAHIANAGYMVDRNRRGAGIGRALVEDSIQRAPLAGFDAVQFNLVFMSNPARALYEELGWREIGRVPAAVEGEDAIIYWRAVGPPAPG